MASSRTTTGRSPDKWQVVPGKKKAPPKVRGAVGYIRVSGLGQEEGDGFRRQELLIRVQAKKRRLEVLGIWQDSITGRSKGGDRPAFREMLRFIDRNRRLLTTVLVESVDRVGRRLTDAERTFQDLTDRGLLVLEASTGEVLAAPGLEPSRVMFRQVKGAIAEMDRSLLVERLRVARNATRKAHGRCEGRKPYGLKAGEEAVLIRIKRWRKKGQGYSWIAARLNAEGITTRTGSIWNRGTVYRIATRRKPIKPKRR